MTDDDHIALLHLAKRHLGMHIVHNPSTHQFYKDLIANADEWPMGFSPEDYYVWVAPRTADGRQLAGPFGVLKWDRGDFCAIVEAWWRDTL